MGHSGRSTCVVGQRCPCRLDCCFVGVFRLVVGYGNLLLWQAETDADADVDCLCRPQARLAGVLGLVVRRIVAGSPRGGTARSLLFR
jgi:hypothetical protein